jgi:hypothetical protein
LDQRIRFCQKTSSAIAKSDSFEMNQVTFLFPSSDTRVTVCTMYVKCSGNEPIAMFTKVRIVVIAAILIDRQIHGNGSFLLTAEMLMYLQDGTTAWSQEEIPLMT